MAPSTWLRTRWDTSACQTWSMKIPSTRNLKQASELMGILFQKIQISNLRSSSWVLSSQRAPRMLLREIFPKSKRYWLTTTYSAELSWLELNVLFGGAKQIPFSSIDFVTDIRDYLLAGKGFAVELSSRQQTPALGIPTEKSRQRKIAT